MITWKKIQTFVKTKQSKKRALMFRFVLHRHSIRGPTFHCSSHSFRVLRLGDLVFSERSLHFSHLFILVSSSFSYSPTITLTRFNTVFLLWSFFLNSSSWRNLFLWCLRETLANCIVWLSNTHSSGREHTCFTSMVFKVAHSLERSSHNHKGTWKGFMFALIWTLLQRIMRTVSASQVAFKSPGRGAKFYMSVKLKWEWASPLTFICVWEEELSLNYPAECNSLELGIYLQFHCREHIPWDWLLDLAMGKTRPRLTSTSIWRSLGKYLLLLCPGKFIYRREERID